MTTNRPRVFYKYFSQSNYRFLENPAFRFTPHSSFNDPFENSPSEPERLDELTKEELIALRAPLNDDHSKSQALIQKSINNLLFNQRKEYTLEEMREHQGTLCLSETHDNLLMWAHYASDHQGYVTELDASYFFELADDPDNAWRVNLDRVQYREMRVLNQPGDWWEYFYGTHHEIATTKSTHWSYEQEWRIDRPLKDADKILTINSNPNVRRDDFGNPYHLFKLPKNILRKIIIGARASKSNLAYIKKTIKADKDLSHVVIKLSIPDPIDFRLRFINISVDDLPDL
ncbi:hypothetical protein QF021_001297 [Acidovorax delafieldii]|uniref:DUF2971 domain-containing protein n=1 Tax=Acidovorax delafieldii TaxID=47920 RepID=UPI0028557FF9|nr:DUF2971 domain-containing protein [Acidovorax delafieldii]MDR6153208.1 hypothetical protein [Acidovorax delafieldii]